MLIFLFNYFAPRKTTKAKGLLSLKEHERKKQTLLWREKNIYFFLYSYRIGFYRIIGRRDSSIRVSLFICPNHVLSPFQFVFCIAYIDFYTSYFMLSFWNVLIFYLSFIDNCNIYIIFFNLRINIAIESPIFSLYSIYKEEVLLKQLFLENCYFVELKCRHFFEHYKLKILTYFY